MLVLFAYVGAQSRILDQDSYLYLVLNVVGSGMLALLALNGRDWGFLLLEGSWAAVTGVALCHRLAAGVTTEVETGVAAKVDAQV
ncbi:CBU_0592 family membrane protein [Actinocorallia longicatena]